MAARLDADAPREYQPQSGAQRLGVLATAAGWFRTGSKRKLNTSG